MSTIAKNLKMIQRLPTIPAVEGLDSAKSSRIRNLNNESVRLSGKLRFIASKVKPVLDEPQNCLGELGSGNSVEQVCTSCRLEYQMQLGFCICLVRKMAALAAEIGADAEPFKNAEKEAADHLKAAAAAAFAPFSV